MQEKEKRRKEKKEKIIIIKVEKMCLSSSLKKAFYQYPLFSKCRRDKKIIITPAEKQNIRDKGEGGGRKRKAEQF